MMSEENDDYDREDLEHVENMLYANIHYNTGCNENQSTASNGNDDDNTPIGLDHGNGSAARRNAKRYWSTNTPTNKGTSNFVPFHKEKHSGIYKPAKFSTKNLNDSSDVSKDHENRDSTATDSTTTVTPKQFTPYVSFLPFNDSSTNVMEEQCTASTSENVESKTVLRTNNDAIRQSLTAKHINPFSKKGTTEQYKNMFNDDDETDEIEAAKNLVNKKRLNPFNPLSRKAKKKKSDASPNKSVRKNREELKQLAANLDVIDVDDADKDDDDDVIILPTQKPPLICLDSSDDENNSPVKEHAFTEPNAVSDNRRKVPRCSSPSSSIQSTDDFIAQNDQRTFGFDSFATLSDEDLCHVSEIVENQLHDKATQNESNNRAAINDNDNAIFTPPKQMQREKFKTCTKKTYEVGANSFTAVDVYESESSDMPDSIYTKGSSNKRKKMSDSDSSSVESVMIPKSKRLRKRKKSSGSAKESDHLHTDESSSDLPPEVDVDTDSDDDENEDEVSYLVRGEALGRTKNTNKKKSTKTNKNNKQAEDDFINKLSSIVRGQDESDNDELENTQGSPAESIEARDIVEAVLQRRTKKMKKNQVAEAENEAPIEAEAEAETKTTDEIPPENPWEITDEIGETDDLNFGRLFTDNEIEPTAEETTSNTIQKTTIESNATSENVAEQETTQNENDNNDEFDLESGWNDDMRRFYNDSWGGETFSMQNIRARMPRGYLNWMIINKDKFPSANRNRQSRCLNCQEKGHLAKNCPRPPAKKICYMCGVEGHIESKCPNAICLNCGNGTQRYTRGCQSCARERMMVCYGCNQKGHRELNCPDKWRRYHSTTTLNKPLIKEAKFPKMPARLKYCCICASSGHYADTCKKSNDMRGRWSAPWNVHISSYRPLLFAPKDKKIEKTKYTILSSDLNEYTFNFGNDVQMQGHGFYARFRRAVKLNNLNQSTSSENDVVFVNETNLRSATGPTIEIDDDIDYDMAGLEDVSASEDFSENGSQDDSFMTIDNIQDETEHDDNNDDKDEETMENSASNEIASKTDAEKDAEIKLLDDKIQTLDELREKMLSYKPNAELEDTTFENIDFDTNNENSATTSKQKDNVSTSSGPLPDFISLTNDQPDRFQPTRSPSPISADSTTNANEKNDATIHLTPQHCKHLLSNKGREMLRDSETKYNVSVRLEWRQFGNVLIVNGIASDQQKFHEILKQFFESIEKAKKTSGVQLPKNRMALINFVRNQLTILDSPLCNVNKLCDVQSTLHRIRTIEQNPSKSNIKKITNLRKHLNMVLFGRYGLGDGNHHLDELQECLRSINQDTSPQVSMEMRQRMSEHIDYIFSGNEHTNYADIVDTYNQLKRDKALPPLNLDRKLLGLKINVYHTSDGNNSNNTPMRKNSFSKQPPPLLKNQMESTAQKNSNGLNNKTNKPQSMLDIQINVSTPSTSYHHNQNESMYPNNSYSSNRDRPLDKWKY